MEAWRLQASTPTFPTGTEGSLDTGHWYKAAILRVEQAPLVPVPVALRNPCVCGPSGSPCTAAMPAVPKLTAVSGASASCELAVAGPQAET